MTACRARLSARIAAALAGAALFLAAGTFTAAITMMPTEAYAGPGGPGGPHGGPPPGARPPGPAYHRPAPPPPRHRHHDRWYNDWGFWGPALTIGAIVGTEIYRNNQPVRVVEVPSNPVVVVPQAQAPAGASYPWYWCSSEQAYYPNVRACPLGWETIMGPSATTPPPPPR